MRRYGSFKSNSSTDNSFMISLNQRTYSYLIENFLSAMNLTHFASGLNRKERLVGLYRLRTVDFYCSQKTEQYCMQNNGMYFRLKKNIKEDLLPSCTRIKY